MHEIDAAVLLRENIILSEFKHNFLITFNVKTVFYCRMLNFPFICDQVKMFCLLQIPLNNLFFQTFMPFSILQLNHIPLLIYKLFRRDCVWFSAFSHASIKLISWTTCKIKYM